MPQDRIGISHAGTNDNGDEQFVIVFVDSEKLETQAGYFMSTSGAMLEEEIRDWFAKGGQPAHEVDAMFKIARDNRKT